MRTIFSLATRMGQWKSDGREIDSAVGKTAHRFIRKFHGGREATH
jgi:hypothetical protein